MSGEICPFPIALRCAICIAPNTESPTVANDCNSSFCSYTLITNQSVFLVVESNIH